MIENQKKWHVNWEGSFLDFGSLSQINCQLTTQLNSVSTIELSRVLTTQVPLTDAVKKCDALISIAQTLKIGSGDSAALTIRHQWPPNWDRPVSGKFVIIQPWEFGSLPVNWVDAAAQVDAFWVPSNYVRDVYIDSGICAEKVVVIPNGIDPEQYHSALTPLALPTEKKYRFLFVGGTIGRKGSDVLLKAYLNTFRATDDVCLVIKDFGGSTVYQGQTLVDQIKLIQQIPNAPEILYVNQEILPQDMGKLYAACDCLVHPYRGEGFGMPILEAMACGLPVIVTQGGAADDFVSEACGLFIEAEKKYFGNKVSELTLAKDGWILEPNYLDLSVKMQYAFSNPEQLRVRGQAGAQIAKEKYTWEQIAKKVEEQIEVLLT